MKKIKKKIIYLTLLVLGFCFILTSCSKDNSDDGNSPDSSTAEAVDLGLSVKWASCNVGATSPEDAGGYYAWGETEVKSSYTLNTYLYYNSANGYFDILKDISNTRYDVAHVKWGGKWRLPTIKEIEELCNKCTSIWTTNNGVYGRKFVGPNGNSIFLPAAGCYETHAPRMGIEGDYMSGSYHSDDVSVPDECQMTWALGLDKDSAEPYNDPPFTGYSVRPVSK